MLPSSMLPYVATCAPDRPGADPLQPMFKLLMANPLQSRMGAIHDPGNLARPAVEGLPECGQGPHVGAPQTGCKSPPCGPCPHSGKLRGRLLVRLPGSWIAPAECLRTAAALRGRRPPEDRCSAGHFPRKGIPGR